MTDGAADYDVKERFRDFLGTPWEEERKKATGRLWASRGRPSQVDMRAAEV